MDKDEAVSAGIRVGYLLVLTQLVRTAGEETSPFLIGLGWLLIAHAALSLVMTSARWLSNWWRSVGRQRAAESKAAESKAAERDTRPDDHEATSP